MLSREMFLLFLYHMEGLKRKQTEHWVHPIYNDGLLQGKFYTMRSKLLNFLENIQLLPNEYNHL